MGVFFRYERLCFSGGILTANHSKAAVCHFRVTKKRRIATTLLSCSAYFVAGVLGIPLVHYVEERGEVVILWFVAVHAVIDCNKAYLLLGEQNLGIKADLKIVSAETAHILAELRSATSCFETVLNISMVRFSLILRAFSHFLLSVVLFLNHGNR